MASETELDLRWFDDLTTCELSDALVSLGEANGGNLGSIERFSPSPSTNSREGGDGGDGFKIVGPAYTVQMVSVMAENRLKPGDRPPKPAQHHIDAAPPGSIIVIYSPPDVRAACWGGLMSTAAKAKGIVGAVIHGGCRDLDEHRQLGFPVFASYHTTLGQKTFVRPAELDIPLTLHSGSGLDNESTIVVPGDVIVCDNDGCVAVPRSRAKEVVEIAKRMKEADENLRRDLEAGRGVQESMAKWRGA